MVRVRKNPWEQGTNIMRLASPLAPLFAWTLTATGCAASRVVESAPVLNTDCSVSQKTELKEGDKLIASDTRFAGYSEDCAQARIRRESLEAAFRILLAAYQQPTIEPDLKKKIAMELSEFVRVSTGEQQEKFRRILESGGLASKEEAANCEIKSQKPLVLVCE